MTQHCIRTAVAQKLVEIASKDHRIVALEADLKGSTQSVLFERAHPGRYIQCGVAEQNMVGMAAGLALSGKVPVVHSFACFISMRTCEQVRTSVAYPNLNVKFIVTHAGVSAGTAGPTHHTTEDLAIMRAIPNMTVLAPGDAIEAAQAIEEAIRVQGPIYIRLAAANAPDVYQPTDRFAIGKATQLREGNDVTIISTGLMMSEAVAAGEMLAKEAGINARVLQMACIKPIDRNAVMKAIKETGGIVAVEEHNVLGGLGSAVCEIAGEFGTTPVIRLGINDRFSDIANYKTLLEHHGLTADNIVKQARALMVTSKR